MYLKVIEIIYGIPAFTKLYFQELEVFPFILFF